MLIKDLLNKASLFNHRLLARKPLFLFRALSVTAGSGLKSDMPIRSLLFHSQYRCNLNCVHCYEKRFTDTDQQPLTIGEKKKLLSTCVNAGVLSVDFVSGESTIDEDLPALIGACRPSGTYITIATNAYDLPEEKIRRLYRLGVDKFNISIDSMNPAEHDSIRRRRGAYENAMNALQLCRKIGVGVQMTILVYRDSTLSEGFRRLVNHAIENRIRTAFKTAVPLGAWEGRTDNLITDQDRNTLYELHAGHPFLVRTCVSGSTATCPGFNRIVAVTAYGDILPCNTIHISFGNIRNDDLFQVIERGRRIPYFNGSFRGCPPSDDIRFIESCLSRTYAARPYPVHASSVFTDCL